MYINFVVITIISKEIICKNSDIKSQKNISSIIILLSIEERSIVANLFSANDDNDDIKLDSNLQLAFLLKSRHQKKIFLFH